MSVVSLVVQGGGRHSALSAGDTVAQLSLTTTGTSLTSANMTANQLYLFIGGTSGATLAVRSGGTIYYFGSTASAVG